MSSGLPFECVLSIECGVPFRCGMHIQFDMVMRRGHLPPLERIIGRVKLQVPIKNRRPVNATGLRFVSRFGP